MKKVDLPNSKSWAARYLVTSHVVPGFPLDETLLPMCTDTEYLHNGLDSDEDEIETGLGGTTLRFLLAYYASKPGVVKVLRPHSRMMERPIQGLVDILHEMGAQINVEDTCIKVYGAKLHGITIDATKLESSQFLSALLLILPNIEGSLTIENFDKIVSKSYVDYTITWLQYNDLMEVHKVYNCVRFSSKPLLRHAIPLPAPDWSGLSFIYAWFITHNESMLFVNSMPEFNMFINEIRKVGDKFGVASEFKYGGLLLKKAKPQDNCIMHNFANIPDEVPAFAVAACVAGFQFCFSGCDTLANKECNRLEALSNELYKLGQLIHYTDSTISNAKIATSSTDNFCINTYNDHRIAMAFGACGCPIDIIENAYSVVHKSWGNFWEVMKNLER